MLIPAEPPTGLFPPGWHPEGSRAGGEASWLTSQTCRRFSLTSERGAAGVCVRSPPPLMERDAVSLKCEQIWLAKSSCGHWFLLVLPAWLRAVPGLVALR